MSDDERDEQQGAEDAAAGGEGEPTAEAEAKKPRRRRTRAKADDAPAAGGDEAADAEAEKEQARGEDAEDDAAGDTDKATTGGRAGRRRRGAVETSTGGGAGTRRRDRRTPVEAVTVRASARYVRTAPRKARLVIDHIRGKSVADARAILVNTPRAASRDVLKLLESCVANAEANHELGADELRVERAFVDEGPTIKRFRPRAQGRATRIRKRTSHMTIHLTNKTAA